ncbi:MAG: glycine betaine/L-proline ABC transporter ATP-binding protein ProV [Betaproteobacteria bacterium]|nr:glycine betaine/L-proline ABC transporter ATP-binding protein ProV [Betaproteobacteria bacterium]
MNRRNQLLQESNKIVVKNLYKIFGDDNAEGMDLLRSGLDKEEILKQTSMVVGVSDVNFSIKQGEIFVVMGLSGSGKSTLVRLLNRLIEPTQGQILFDEIDITLMSDKELTAFRRKEVNMVFQSFALMPHMNVIENVAFGLELAGMTLEERQLCAARALEQVGLATFSKKYPDELSGGMKQRVGLARALATDPDVMLMDEAFSALDPLIRKEMQDELLKLQDRKRRTIVFITHDVDEAMKLGDRVAVMANGNIIQIGTPQEILNNPANEYVSSFFRGVATIDVLCAKDIVQSSDNAIISIDDSNLETSQNVIRNSKREFAYVVDGDKKLIGVVSNQSIQAAIMEDSAISINSALIENTEALNENAKLRGVIGAIAASTYDLPVVTDSNIFLGVITKDRLLKTIDDGHKTSHG